MFLHVMLDELHVVGRTEHTEWQTVPHHYNKPLYSCQNEAYCKPSSSLAILTLRKDITNLSTLRNLLILKSKALNKAILHVKMKL